MSALRRGSVVAGVMLALVLVLSVVGAVVLVGRGEDSSAAAQASVSGRVPTSLLPVSDGQVTVELIRADADGAEPVATVSTSAAESGYFTLSAAPGRYIVRASSNPAAYGLTSLSSAPIDLREGLPGEVQFTRP